MNDIFFERKPPEYANRKAMEAFDAWNDVTGFVEPNTSYYYEIQAVIEDAVWIGAAAADGFSIEIVDGRPRISVPDTRRPACSGLIREVWQ